MTEKKTAIRANHQKPMLMTASRTNNLAMKPTVGGTPAMEAAATGLPLVVTDIRGCRQVVDPEVNGLLVAPRDAGALTRAVARLVDDADLRCRMGDASVAKAAADFDQRRVIETTLATYRRLLGTAAPT